MRSIKCRGLQQAGTTLILFGAIAVKINPTADAAGVMKERLVF
jgi:hypothetical protein